ncbi:MAG: 4-(cytidine 5'-diphospho)-2-C-methyl-D-erythritol kinase [bacterium]|nr:4-(cytidine 5'-diphospho)-2-C-methyl-D-erythritol kinase [bacterium]
MIELRAPAKLNLGLELMARRPDGYHDIDTVFLPLRLFDRLEMELAPVSGIELTIRGAELAAGSDNLATRGAQAAARALDFSHGIRIRLEKHIPIAAGLGGGSADAAMAILGVELLSGGRLSDTRRSEIAREIGADVPFFLDPRPARGRGVGELLEPIGSMPEMWWLLGVFSFPISTPWAYSEASRQLTLPRDGSSIAALLGPKGISSDPPNDLEFAAARRHPEIREVRQALADVGATITGMSGSGPTVYGRFGDRDAARRAAMEVKLPEGVRTIAVSSPGSSQSDSSNDWGWGVAKR